MPLPEDETTLTYPYCVRKSLATIPLLSKAKKSDNHPPLRTIMTVLTDLCIPHEKHPRKKVSLCQRSADNRRELSKSLTTGFTQENILEKQASFLSAHLLIHLIAPQLGLTEFNRRFFVQVNFAVRAVKVGSEKLKLLVLRHTYVRGF